MDGQVNSAGHQPHPQNAEGPFYVRNGECMSCGAPELQAPTMMSHDGRGHCFFVRQPSTQEETDGAILGLWTSCCGAIRYRGQNREILIRLAEQGLADQCDYRLEEEPRRARRNYVWFQFEDAEALKEGSEAARVILEYFASSLTELMRGVGKVREFKCSASSSSFRYDWGDDSRANPHSVTLVLEFRNERDWLLRILKNETASTAFAINIYKAMRRDLRFRRAQWFSEETWHGGAMGRPSPY